MVAPNKLLDRPVLALWLGLAFALLSLGGAVAFNLHLEYEHVTTREGDRLAAQARVIAENIEHQLAKTNITLEVIRNELPNWKGQSGQQERLYRLKAFSRAGIRYLAIMDAEGTILAANLPEFAGHNFSHRDYFQAAKQQHDADTLYVSPPFKSASGPYVINLTRMISGPKGEFAGIITASLDPEYFATLLSSVLYAPGMWDAVGHGDGQLFLMMPAREDLNGMNLAQPGSLFTRHRNSGQVATVLTGTMDSTKEEWMMAQRTVQPAQLKMDKPLVVAVSRDLDAILRPWRRTAQTQAGLFGLIALICVLGLYIHQYRQRKLEQQAAEAHALADRFSMALDRIPAYIYMKDRQRRYVYANRPTLELFNCSKEELPGSDDGRFFPPDTVARLRDIDTRVLEHGEDTAEEVIVRGADGSQRVYWEIETPMYDNTDKTRICGLCGISTDITERKLLQEKLEQQAHQDYLTRLFNRRHFMEQGQLELSRAQRYSNLLSVFMLDIDFFKNVNDTHGHKAGDIVLQKLGDILRETLRSIDIVGRIGGEEFAVLLPETNIQKATEVAERLREITAGTDVVLEDGLPLHFTISIGVAALKGKDTNIDMLLSQADKALYQAKESGRNKVCVAD